MSPNSVTKAQKLTSVHHSGVGNKRGTLNGLSWAGLLGQNTQNPCTKETHVPKSLSKEINQFSLGWIMNFPLPVHVVESRLFSLWWARATLDLRQWLWRDQDSSLISNEKHGTGTRIVLTVPGLSSTTSSLPKSKT